MKKILAAAAVVGLLAVPAVAASADIADAIKTFEGIAADPAKLKTFCDMNAAMESAGEADDAAIDALDKKVEGYMKTLGPDVEKAFDVGGDLDPDSDDGKAYDAAVEKLEKNCS